MKEDQDMILKLCNRFEKAFAENLTDVSEEEAVKTKITVLSTYVAFFVDTQVPKDMHEGFLRSFVLDIKDLLR